MEFKPFFSPNHDIKERPKKSINMIVVHYTGMQSERESLKKLCDFKSKVSCHYLISRNGNIYRLIKDKNIAWHSGVSCWLRKKNLNKYSIGIELQNKGHQFGYTNFTQKQISQLISLCKMLIKKYKIAAKNIVGHADISPDRKIDPGEKFPWKTLSKNKIGIWHNLNPIFLRKLRRKQTQKNDKEKFVNYLKKIGYCINSKSSSLIYIKTIKSFQRHFRKEIIDGLLDKECLIIALNLANNVKKA